MPGSGGLRPVPAFFCEGVRPAGCQGQTHRVSTPRRQVRFSAPETISPSTVQLESAPLNLPRPKKIRLPRAERELQILKIALERFISKGYQGTSMEDIAEAAGISRPIVYNLFGSKDAIYLACLRDARQQLDQRLVEAGSAPPHVHGHARLRAGIDGYFRFVEQDRAAWRLLFGG